MAENNENRLNELKRMHEEVNWQTEEERLEFIRQLERWISDWQGQPPNLLDIFQPEEIERLLWDCIKNISEEDTSRYRAFVEFVARSGYEHVSQVDQDGKPPLRRTTPIHLAAKRSLLDLAAAAPSRRTTPIHFEAKRSQLVLAAAVGELFQVYKCDTNYSDESGYTHFHVAVQFGCDDVVERFLKLGQDPNILVPGTADSPLHLALIFDRKKIGTLLVNSGAKFTLVNKKGLTPIDLILEYHRDDPNRLFLLKDENYPAWLVRGPLRSAVSNGLVNLTKLLLRRCTDLRLTTTLPRNFYDLWMNELMPVRVFKKFHQDDLAEIASELIDEQGQQLLHLALLKGNVEAAELLLRRGADPNSTNAQGETALHVIARATEDDDSVTTTMERFFEVCDALGRQVSVDARDDRGYTALHCAGRSGRIKTTDLLLRRGADANLTYPKNSTTLLHDFATRAGRFQFPMTLFEIIDERTRQRRVRVDARDDKGNTPLHLALRRCNKAMAELLLRVEADPNLPDAEGSTALHLIVKDRFAWRGWELVELFFKICDDNRQFVQIDAQDKLGRTPLQWAVADVKPLVVATLLDRGAEVSRFVFPTESYYGATFDPTINYAPYVKLNMASGALLSIEILEDAGYELARGDALTIVKFFAKHGLHEKSANFKELWRDDGEVANELKKHRIGPDATFDDLMRMRPEEAKNVLLLEVCRSKGVCRLSDRYSRPCHEHLFEKLSRRFFRNWALESFMELIHNRLPLECCEMIIDELQNEDLFNICLAAASDTASVTANSNSDNRQ